MPVPTAVPPRASSARSGRAAVTLAAPLRTWAAYPPNSWPRRTGVASMRWVLPDFTTESNSTDFASSETGQALQGRQEVLGHGERGGQMDGRGDDVVGRLAGIDVIVGVDAHFHRRSRRPDWR